MADCIDSFFGGLDIANAILQNNWYKQRNWSK